jgi:hypothetical protein
LWLGEEHFLGTGTEGFVEHVDDVEEKEGALWMVALSEGLLHVVVKLGLGSVCEEFDAAVHGNAHLALGKSSA